MPSNTIAFVKYNVLAIAVAVLGGVSNRLCQQISPQEFGNFVWRGLATIGSCCASWIGFMVIGHALYGDYLSDLVITMGALAAALFISVIDICFLYRFPLYQIGLKELSRAGLRLPYGGSLASKFATGFRISGCLSNGAVVGLFLSMAAYFPDISTEVTAEYLRANKTIASQFAQVQDAAIKRATAEVETETASVRDFDRQIGSLQQTDIRAALNARRKGWAVPAPVAGPQLAALQGQKLSAVTRLDRLKTDLAGLIENRNANVLKAIDTAPDHAPKRDGLLGRLAAFGRILDQNPHLLVIVAAIEMISIGLEMAPVLAHLLWVPSAFAAQLALDHLKTVTQMAREGAEAIAGIPGIAPDLPAEANSSTTEKRILEPLQPESPSTPPDQSSQHEPAPNLAQAAEDGPVPDPAVQTTPDEPPRRGRGRPKKVPMNGLDINSPLA